MKRLLSTFIIIAFTLAINTSPVYGAVTQINPGNLNSVVTGQQASTTIGLDVTLLSKLAGELLGMDRMAVTFAFTCVATTTDSLLFTGAGVVFSNSIGAHTTDTTVNFFDATTSLSAANVKFSDHALNSSNGTLKTMGLEVATGAYLDIIGTATTTACYRISS